MIIYTHDSGYMTKLWKLARAGVFAFIITRRRFLRLIIQVYTYVVARIAANLLSRRDTRTVTGANN